MNVDDRVMCGYRPAGYKENRAMKRPVMLAILALVMVSMCANAHALSLVPLDNFNDGIIVAWTPQTGSFSESGGQFTGSPTSLATRRGQAGFAIGVDAVTSTNGTSYVALVLDYESLSDNLFVKIQDQSGNGLFDRVFFYHGNNSRASAIVGTAFFDLTTEVGATYFEARDNGDGTVTAFVGANGDVFGGTLVNSYTGTGVGLGFFGSGAADNFYVVPEPSTLTLALLATLGLSFYRRRRRRVG